LASIDGPDDPGDDVGYEGIVAPRSAVAEHRHRLAAVDQPGELGDGQVGATAGTIGRDRPRSVDPRRIALPGLAPVPRRTPRLDARGMAAGVTVTPGSRARGIGSPSSPRHTTRRRVRNDPRDRHARHGSGHCWVRSWQVQVIEAPGLGVGA
jgi:hypothetical protein